MTQQEADAAPDVVTCIISILDHDAYTLVDPGATHSFASNPFLDRFQIETQPLEGRMRVSLPTGDPLLADRVVRDSRVLIEAQEFPADLVALDMRDFHVVLGMYLTGPDPDTPPRFPGWSRLVEFLCTIPRECIKGPHLKEI